MTTKTYQLKPTGLIPNSPHRLLYYPSVFPSAIDRNPATIHDLFKSNGWEVQWIFRYGPTQQSHYHSLAHECMIVLSGSATIRFGVADAEVPSEADSSSHDNVETGGVEIHVQAGDALVLPAGIAHKTFNAEPESSFKLLSPGDGHRVGDEDAKAALGEVVLSGFTMIGGYPAGSEWNFATGGEDVSNYDRVWSVPKPDRDPVRGSDDAGLCGLWK